jgi:hypothetical protein
MPNKGDLSNVATSEGFAEDPHIRTRGRKDERWEGGLIGAELDIAFTYKAGS